MVMNGKKDVGGIMLTETKKKQLKRNRLIYREYNELVAAGCMKTAATDFLMAKYEIAARSTIWNILKRVEKENGSGGL